MNFSYEFRKGLSVGSTTKNSLFESFSRSSDGKKVVWQIFWEWFNPDAHPLPGRPYYDEQDALPAILKKKPEISSEEIAKRLKKISQLTFAIWQDLGSRFWQIKKVSFCNTTT